MADTFKNITIDLTTTTAKQALYTCPVGDDTDPDNPKVLPTTSIVKSLRVTNDSASACTLTVLYKDVSNSNFEARFHKEEFAADSETELLDKAPLVMESGDQILLTPSNENRLHVIMSVLEIT